MHACQYTKTRSTECLRLLYPPQTPRRVAVHSSCRFHKVFRFKHRFPQECRRLSHNLVGWIQYEGASLGHFCLPIPCPLPPCGRGRKVCARVTALHGLGPFIDQQLELGGVTIAHLDFISANDHIRADWKKLDKKKIEAATRVLFLVMTKLICGLGRELHLAPEDRLSLSGRFLSYMRNFVPNLSTFPSFHVDLNAYRLTCSKCTLHFYCIHKI